MSSLSESQYVEQRRRQLYQLLGDLPPRNAPISSQTLSRVKKESYWLETLVLHLNGLEPVPAFLVIPSELPPPYPCILYNHAHGGDYKTGKMELLVGRGALQDPPYAQVLTQNGIAALCIDHWGFGERRGRSETELFKHMLWNGQVLWGMMVYDSLCALDLLTTRTEIDPTRIGTMGLSMGSTMAWWTAALDTRVKVCIDLCCLTDFDALIETRGLDGHGIYYYVPSLQKHFTAAQINALIAPRYRLSLNGNYDPLTPPAGLDRIDRELKTVYAESGFPENWELVRENTGHFETAVMRSHITNALKTQL